MEKTLFRDRLVKQQLVYENIEFVKPQNFAKLKEDLETRMGRRIKKIEIRSLNYLNDSALLNVYYTPDAQENLYAITNLD